MKKTNDPELTDWQLHKYHALANSILCVLIGLGMLVSTAIMLFRGW